MHNSLLRGTRFELEADGPHLAPTLRRHLDARGVDLALHDSLLRATRFELETDGPTSLQPYDATSMPGGSTLPRYNAEPRKGPPRQWR